jgi:hypothetical protein
VSDDESADNLARIEKAWRIRNLIYVGDEPEGLADSKTNEEVSDGNA